MTLAEFKAWFSGFTEDMDGPPNEKQWKRIKAKIKEIDGTALSYPVFVDRYVEPYRRYLPMVPYWSACNALGTGMSSHLNAYSTVSLNAGDLSPGASHDETFDMGRALADAGKAEYLSMLNS